MKRFLYIFLAILISSSLLFFFYQNVIQNPNAYLFAHEGDGLTNYYTFAYHIKNDQSLSEFKGMNYPFGEALLYTDSQPILAALLQFVEKNGFAVSDYSVGILNVLMLLSILVSVIFLYRILEVFGFNALSCILGSISISFLSSQALLWNFGHFALSYVCFFPLSWYLYIMYLRKPGEIRFTIYIMLNTIFWFYIHTYLGMIILSFTFLSQLASYIGNIRQKFFDQSYYIEVFLQCIFPAILVYAGITMFDHHPGRIEMPYQPQYRASFYSVFLPNLSWIKNLYKQVLDLSVQDRQSWAQVGNYIGLSTTLSLIVGLILLTKDLVLKGFKGLANFLPNGLWAMLVASILLLAFASAFPFRFDLSYLLPVILKQFVSMGRFAWVFYYVSTVVGLYIIWKLNVNETIKTILISLSCLLLLTEAYAYHELLSEDVQQKENVFIKENESILPLHAYNWLKTSTYQAILPLPFYHGYISLHKYKGTYKSVELSEVLSLHTGLPMMSASTARSSVYESQRIAEIFLPGYYPKAVNEYLNDDDILITYTGEDLNQHEKNLLSKATFMFRSGENQFYKLKPSDLFYYNGSVELANFKANEDSLVLDKNSGWYTIDSLSYGSIIYNGFDKDESEKVLRGDGAVQFKKTMLNKVFETKQGQLLPNVDYELSFYYYNELFDQSFNSVWLEIRKGDEILHEIRIDPIKSFLYYGNWAFNKINFRIDDSDCTVRLMSEGSDLYSDDIYFDELLIRPVNVDVYNHIYSDVILRNNENVVRF